MIGITAIGAYLPPEYIDNKARAAEFGMEQAFIEEKLGFIKLPRKPREMETSDMCLKAFENLQETTTIQREKIDCVVVCTQNPDGVGLPHTSAIVQYKLGLQEGVAGFDISLGCSGYVYGLSIIKSFMEANGLKNGLLFTADPYSKVLDETDRDTELLFGDGAACTYLSEQSQYELLQSVFCTNGQGRGAIGVDPRTNHLSMRGKDVFMFVMKKVPQQIAECLTNNGFRPEDVDLYIFHQASRYLVENLRKQMNIPTEKAPFAAQNTGNTVSSSIPLVLKQKIHEDYGIIVLSGFGVGLSWASTMLQKKVRF